MPTRLPPQPGDCRHVLRYAPVAEGEAFPMPTTEQTRNGMIVAVGTYEITWPCVGCLLGRLDTLERAVDALERSQANAREHAARPIDIRLHALEGLVQVAKGDA